MELKATLDQAILAAKEGRKAEARRLLETVLDADERNEQAWLWLSGLVDSDEERSICLENVLTINPHNEAARKGLRALGATPAADQTSALHTPTGSSTTPGFQSSAEIDAPDRVETSDLLSSDRRTFIVITIVLALMLICTVVSILGFVILSPAG